MSIRHHHARRCRNKSWVENLQFPKLSKAQMKGFLQTPETLVRDWFSSSDALNQCLSLAASSDLICDGWTALLPFLPSCKIEMLENVAKSRGIDLHFVATRNMESTVRSELHHWIIQ